ncbi:MAG TPA: hypothetical protein VHC01_12895 [Gaiellaceae bacterium]|nr:hypothetical protein [Gaiellaceae bacterium]
MRELEGRTGERATDLLARAVEQLRRSLILSETNTAYGRLAESDRDELADWDATLEDGLEDVD